MLDVFFDVAAGNRTVTWVAAVDFRRGADMSVAGQPCRNYGKLEKITDGFILGAVADGSIVSPRSHIGAKTAVRSAIAALKADAETVKSMVGRHDLAASRQVFDEVVRNVQSVLRRTAFDEVASIAELATSLTVFVAGPLGLAAMQVGAGLFVYRPRGGSYDLVLSDAVGEEGSVTDTGAAADMRIALQRGPIEFLCLASGALRSFSIGSDDGVPREPFFRPLDRYASVALDDGEVHRGVREFLRSGRLSEESGSDVTLALCRYVPGRSAGHDQDAVSAIIAK